MLLLVNAIFLGFMGLIWSNKSLANWVFKLAFVALAVLNLVKYLR